MMGRVIGWLSDWLKTSREDCSSIPGLVKLVTVSSMFALSFMLRCFVIALPKMDSATCYTIRCNTASMMKI